MKLYKLNYKENINSFDKNQWEIKDLIVWNMNLIVGKNATGKTRVLNVINHTAKMIRSTNKNY